MNSVQYCNPVRMPATTRDSRVLRRRPRERPAFQAAESLTYSAHMLRRSAILAEKSPPSAFSDSMRRASQRRYSGMTCCHSRALVMRWIPVSSLLPPSSSSSHGRYAAMNDPMTSRSPSSTPMASLSCLADDRDCGVSIGT